MTPDQAMFVAQAVTQLAWALMALAGAVFVAAVVLALGYWTEYKAWKSGTEVQ